MRYEKTFWTSVVFLFYVFLFQEIDVAITALNPATPLYPIFRIIPIVIGVIIGVCGIYFIGEECNE